MPGPTPGVGRHEPLEPRIALGKEILIMDDSARGRLAGGVAGFLAGLNPLNSKTFILALVIAGFAAWRWQAHADDPQRVFPIYGVVAASYGGGYLIGRLFRRMLKLVAIAAALVISSLVVLKVVHVDTTKARESVTAGASWLQQQGERAQESLMHLLPSGTAAGFGAFAGGRRRGAAPATEPPRQT